MTTSFCILTPFVGQAELVDRIVAVINDDIILMTELEQSARTFQKNQGREKAVILRQSDLSAEEKKAALNQLINDKLTLQQVTRQGLKVTEAEIDATIERIKEINRFSDEAMLKMIELEGLTFQEFQERIRNQLLQNRLVNLEVKSKIVITDEDVKAHYAANQRMFGGKVRYRLRQILLRYSENTSEDEKGRVYQQINEILARLEGGESFGKLAQLYSQGPSAANGGDLGFFELRLLASHIRPVIEGLKAGEHSGIIESEQGYQILLVDQIEATKGESLGDAASVIKEKLYAELMEEKFNTWLAQLRSQAHIKILD